MLVTIDGICAHVVPHGWHARSCGRHSPATTPAALDAQPVQVGQQRANLNDRL
jgi:hypothetical protein